MTRRSKVWLVLAVLFTLVNLAGIVFAAAAGEVAHTALHVVLSVLGAIVVKLLASTRNARRFGRTGESADPDAPGEFTDRLTNLEQSVDAVAIEIERIGEGQRFMTNFFAEKGVPRSPDAGAGEPTASKPDRPSR